MAYGSGGRAVAPGDILEARGFRYQVAASGASDQHAATAGGVKLTVLPFGGAWHIAAFGTSTAAAQKAINVACATGGGEVVFPASCNYYGPLTVTTPTADGLGSSTLRLRLSGAGHGSHWTASGTGIMLDIGNDYTQSFCVDF
jgi:Periplasmic copper-binding protein (NosD)